MTRAQTDIDAIFSANADATEPCWRYALADPAQDKSLPAALQSESRGLFGDGSVAAVSPHLVQLPSDPSARAWRWIARHAPRTPCIIVFASEMGFDALFTHLRRFLDVLVTGHKSMHLAFWDPAILAALIGQPDDDTLHVKGPIFSARQRAAFLEPIRDGWYWDRRQQLRHIAPAMLDEAAPAPSEEGEQAVSVTPLVFKPTQVDQIVKAAVPDQVLYELQLNRPGVLDGRSDADNYALSSRLVTAAYGLKIRGLQDLVNFVGTGMILGEDFHRHPAIEPHLQDVAAGKRRFTEALGDIPAEVLEQAMQASPAAVTDD